MVRPWLDQADHRSRPCELMQVGVRGCASATCTLLELPSKDEETAAASCARLLPDSASNFCRDTELMLLRKVLGEGRSALENSKEGRLTLLCSCWPHSSCNCVASARPPPPRSPPLWLLAPLIMRLCGH